MKKIIALILIVLIYIGSAYAISYSAESALRNYAAQLDSQPAYDAELSDFRHGLLTSTAHLRVDVDTNLVFGNMDPDQREQIAPVIAAMEQGLPFRVDIAQGPLVFRNGLYAGLFKAEFTLTNEVEWAQSLRDTLQRDSIMDNELRMSFTGEGKGYLRMDPFRDGDNVFGGMQTDYTLSDFGRHVSVAGEFSPSTFSRDNSQLQLGLISFSSEGELSDDFISDGRFDIQVSTVEFSDAGSTLFRLQDLTMDMDARIDENNEERFSTHYRFDIGGIEGDALAQPVTGIHLDLGMLNLDRAAVNALYENSATSADMDDPFAAQMQMMNAASALLAGNPEFQLNTLSWEQGPDIQLDMNGNLSFTEDAGNTANTQNPFMLLNQLILDLDLDFTPGFFSMVSESYVDTQLADLEMDPAFVEQMREQQLAQHQAVLQQLVQNGMIDFDGDRYSIILAMENGQFTVNGTPMPLPF